MDLDSENIRRAFALEQATKKLNDFVEHYKPRIKDLPRHQDWESDIWDLWGVAKFNKPIVDGYRAHFRKLSEIKGEKTGAAFFNPFRDFAKAWIMRLITLNCSGGAISTDKHFLSVVESVLSKYKDREEHPIAALVIEDVEAISEFITARYADSVIASMNQKLQSFVEQLNEKGFIADSFSWTWTGKRYNSCLRKTDQASKEVRNSKLPSKAAMKGIMHVYNLSTEPYHVLVTSICAILTGLPGRIIELLTLPLICEVEEERNGYLVYGLSWHPAKGAPAFTKESLDASNPFVPIYKEALSRCRAVTENGRALAKWYEQNPTKVYLSKKNEHLRNKEYLSWEEVGKITGITTKEGIIFFTKRHQIKSRFKAALDRYPLQRYFFDRSEFLSAFDSQFGKFIINNDTEDMQSADILTAPQILSSLSAPWSGIEALNKWAYRHQVRRLSVIENNFWNFKQIEDAIISLLPRGFPLFYNHKGTKIKYSEALFVVQKKISTSKNGTSSFSPIPTKFSYGTVNKLLGRHDGVDQLSIFDAFGLCEPDGSPISIDTHDIRHFHNNRALLAGVRSEWIDKISGRKNHLSQSAYDHRTREQKAKPLSALASGGHLFGEIHAFKPNAPMTPEDIEQKVNEGSKHKVYVVTEYGICEHNYSISPCPAFRDCLNCREHECVKGLPTKTENIRRALAAAEELYKDYCHAGRNGNQGKARWAEKTILPNLMRMRRILGVMEDPSWPIGTRVRIDPAMAVETPVEKALRQRLLHDKAEALDDAEFQNLLAHLSGMNADSIEG